MDLIKDINLKSKRFKDKKVNLRTGLILILLVFLILGYQGFQIQIIKSSEYSYKAARLNVVEKYIEPLRGLFFDKNGVQLTQNLEKYDVYLINKTYKNDELSKLSETLNSASIKFSLEETQKQLESSKFDVRIVTNLEVKLALDLQDKLKDLNVVYFKSGFIRNYFESEYFAHIIGYTGGVTPEDVENGYDFTDQIGKYRLESQYENDLKGYKGKQIFIGGVETRQESIPGDNLYLTLDSKWQRALYNILGEESDSYDAAGAGGVVMDAQTGDVIAMVSYPGFDANLFVRGIPESIYSQYSADRKKPLTDKVISDHAPPGSTFKIITADTLLENGFVDENTTYFSNRCIALGTSKFCEFGELFYGQMDIVRAIYKSSNLFFCTNLLKAYYANQMDKFVNTAKSFGIGEKTGIELDGEITGNMDSPEFRAENGLPWYEGDTCNAAIGQGAILTTPMQMAVVAAAIENGGKILVPNLIKNVVNNEGEYITSGGTLIKRELNISDKTFSIIKEGMHDVANYYDGTVYPFLKDLPGDIRAKTGTAEAYETIDGKEYYKTHGWIVGSFSYQDKRYAFAFHMNYGGGGFYIGKSLQRFITCVYSDFRDCI